MAWPMPVAAPVTMATLFFNRMGVFGIWRRVKTLVFRQIALIGPKTALFALVLFPGVEGLFLFDIAHELHAGFGHQIRDGFRSEGFNEFFAAADFMAGRGRHFRIQNITPQTNQLTGGILFEHPDAGRSNPGIRMAERTTVAFRAGSVSFSAADDYCWSVHGRDTVSP